jgi:hypothetical protein
MLTELISSGNVDFKFLERFITSVHVERDFGFWHLVHVGLSPTF